MTPERFLALGPCQQECEGWLRAERHWPEWGPAAVVLVQQYMARQGWIGRRRRK